VAVASETVSTLMTRIASGLTFFAKRQFRWTFQTTYSATFVRRCALIAATEREQPLLALAVPTVTGLVILITGGFQFTKGKADQLAIYRQGPNPNQPAHAGSAWGLGLRFGLHCASVVPT
jgi:predicted metal-binding membrane protein